MESKQFIAVIGLGYVGLPLAVEFAKKYSVVGFDINENRIKELRKGCDHTLEIEEEDLKRVLCKLPGDSGLFCTDKISDISACNYYLITVPTPTDRFNPVSYTHLTL